MRIYFLIQFSQIILSTHVGQWNASLRSTVAKQTKHSDFSSQLREKLSNDILKNSFSYANIFWQKINKFIIWFNQNIILLVVYTIIHSTQRYFLGFSSQSTRVWDRTSQFYSLWKKLHFLITPKSLDTKPQSLTCNFNPNYTKD